MALKSILPEIKPADFTKSQRMPSLTYEMQIEKEHIEGLITDDIEAVKQAVYKVINTERYDFIIYSSNYGIELMNLFGMPIYYVIPVLPERFRDAIMQDDRVTDVDNFDIKESENERGVVEATFTVHSVFGSFDVTKEVRIS